MVKIKKFKTLEEGIKLLHDEAKSQPITLGKVLKLLSGKGRPLIVLLLCLPFCQPLVIPGTPIPFGLAIAFIGIRMAFGKKVWLPKKILAKKISNKNLKKITSTTLKVVKKMDKWIHPRIFCICHSPVMEVMNGILLAILGIILALPLPIPLSNIIAAWSIFFVALGILKDDGLFVLFGYFISLITISVIIGILYSIRHYYLHT
jgi:hypothetical protein